MSLLNGKRDGFSLVEAMVALLLVAILTTALARSVQVARRLTYSNAQRVAAFGMCKSRLEEVRGMEYGQVSPTNFVTETGLQFAHLSGRDRLPLNCERTVSVTEQTEPTRKDIQVTLSWDYRSRTFNEQIDAVVYPR